MYLRAARAQSHSYPQSDCRADSHQDSGDADSSCYSHPDTHPSSDPCSHACQYALSRADPTPPYAEAGWLVWPQPAACAWRSGQNLHMAARL